MAEYQGPAEDGDGRIDDLVLWWPVPIAGVSVTLLRFDGVASLIGRWLWVPVAAGLLVSVLRVRARLRLGRPTAVLAIFVAVQLISVLWSPDPQQGLWLAALSGAFLLAYVSGVVHGPPTGSSVMPGYALASGAVAIAGLAVVTNPPPSDGLNPDRILAMGVIALLVFSWYGPRSRYYTLLVGLASLIAVIASGSRMATLVVGLLLITAPGLRLPLPGRLLLGGVLVTLFALASTTTQFQERWFISGEGGLIDLFDTGEIETSGRLEVWSEVADLCMSPILGEGAGASNSFAREANTGFPEPHNEYLRVWCDTGIAGTLLFWGFIGFVLLEAAERPSRPRRRWADHAALQLGAALLLLSLTDNPLTTAVPFMIPAGLVLGWSHSEKHRTVLQSADSSLRESAGEDPF